MLSGHESPSKGQNMGTSLLQSGLSGYEADHLMFEAGVKLQQQNDEERG